MNFKIVVNTLGQRAIDAHLCSTKPAWTSLQLACISVSVQRGQVCGPLRGAPSGPFRLWPTGLRRPPPRFAPRPAPRSGSPLISMMLVSDTLMQVPALLCVVVGLVRVLDHLVDKVRKAVRALGDQVDVRRREHVQLLQRVVGLRVPKGVGLLQDVREGLIGV